MEKWNTGSKAWCLPWSLLWLEKVPAIALSAVCCLGELRGAFPLGQPFPSDDFFVKSHYV